MVLQLNQLSKIIHHGLSVFYHFVHEFFLSLYFQFPVKYYYSIFNSTRILFGSFIFEILKNHPILFVIKIMIENFTKIPFQNIIKPSF